MTHQSSNQSRSKNGNDFESYFTQMTGIKKMKKLLINIWEVFALRLICSIFENDAHNIVSKKGWEILNKK